MQALLLLVNIVIQLKPMVDLAIQLLMVKYRIADKVIQFLAVNCNPVGSILVALLQSEKEYSIIVTEIRISSK